MLTYFLSLLQSGSGKPRGGHGLHRAHDAAHIPDAAGRGGAHPLHHGYPKLLLNTSPTPPRGAITPSWWL